MLMAGFRRNAAASPYTVALLLFLCAFAPSPLQAQENAIESLKETSKAFASVAKSVSPSVVFIQVESRSPATTYHEYPFGEDWPFSDDFLRRFFGEDFPGFQAPQQPEGERRSVNQGSGFVFAGRDGVLRDKAYILTNNHLLQDADRIRVTFQDGREFDAAITGTDPQSDVAVLEIPQAGLPAVRLGDSSKLEVGEWVVAIGNPFGLSHTLTVGVVSATGRTTLGINDYEDFIQTDAAINPGNSGGPLVNLDSEVIGINTAIFTRSGGYMGVGFAIPVNLARVIADQLIEHGEVVRGYLGVIIQPLTADLAKSFGISETQGILIAQVAEDSPASKAGLRQGDVVVAYQGEPVTDTGEFRNRISLSAPGSRQKIALIRDGKRRDVNVTIGKLTEEPAVAAQAPSQSTEELGLTVQSLTPDVAEQFGVAAGEGVLVTAVARGSIAAQAGIRPGAIVLQVNRKAVKTASEFKQAVDASSADKSVLLLVRQDDVQQYVVLRW